MGGRGWFLGSTDPLALTFACALASSCNAGDDPAGGEAVVACDPLTAEERAIELGDVLAAGRGADGQVYVLSENEHGELLAFVSEEGVLQRRRVSGEGSSNEGGTTTLTATVQDAPFFTLYLETAADGTVIFVRTESEERIVSADDVEAAEMLELIGEDELADFELRNLAPLVWIEYSGTLDDGRRVLVVRPADDWSFADFRVFLGTADRMLERDVREVSRTRDGKLTRIELTIDGEPAQLRVSRTSIDGEPERRLAVLEHGERFAIELDLEPDRSELEDLDYFCPASAALGPDSGETAYRPID
jgi:hypothetical protein